MKKIIDYKNRGQIVIQATVTNQDTTLKLIGWNEQDEDYVPLIKIFPEMESDYVSNELREFQEVEPTFRKYKQTESVSVTCYSDPEIERAYQALRQLWIVISKATELSPRAQLCKSQLKEIGFK